MQATLWSRDTLFMAFWELSKDILDVDVKITMDKLPFIKDFLGYQAREEEMKIVGGEYDLWYYSESS